MIFAVAGICKLLEYFLSQNYVLTSQSFSATLLYTARERESSHGVTDVFVVLVQVGGVLINARIVADVAFNAERFESRVSFCLVIHPRDFVVQ